LILRSKNNKIGVSGNFKAAVSQVLWRLGRQRISFRSAFSLILRSKINENADLKNAILPLKAAEYSRDSLVEYSI